MSESGLKTHPGPIVGFLLAGVVVGLRQGDAFTAVMYAFGGLGIGVAVGHVLVDTD
ncbi:MAG: hypothetical protein ABEH83_05145 [Halobacterium sp.]